MNVKILKRRVETLLAQRKAQGGPLRVVAYLPAKEHDPTNRGVEFPCIRRMGSSAIIQYRVEDGRPSGPELARLIKEVTS